MNLTESVFKDSARRLAVLDNTLLSSAQDKLANVLGFTNYDAARKAVLGQASPAPNPPQHRAGRRWMGLFATEMLALVMDYNTPTSCPAGSNTLARVVFFDVFSRPERGDVTVQELSEALRLDALLGRYHEITVLGRKASPAERGYVLYLEGLPGFHSYRGSPHFAGRDEHSAIASPINWALNSLAFVELAGADDEMVAELLERPDCGHVQVRNTLHHIEERVRFGSYPA